MLTHLRFAAFAAAALAGVWAGGASAQRPAQQVARLEPGYGGVCEDCDLRGRILVGARMSRSVFNRSNFSNAVLTRADASGSSFEDADFTGADLSHARLTDAQCPNAVFRDAVLANADARDADFSGADFTRARLDGANLSGADMSEARGLRQAQLNRACGNAATLLPRGLRLPRCD